MTGEPAKQATVVGRSSSHFTRVTRIFAAEVAVEVGFRAVPDLMSLQPADYGGHPALKVPALETPTGVWFGALNICRELSRRSPIKPHVVWPEDHTSLLIANAQEVIVQAMATEVGLIMAGATDAGPPQGNAVVKMRASLDSSLRWLDNTVEAVLAALPRDRDLSYLEVTLFCLTTHLDFRQVLATTLYPRLNEFCDVFASRPSALQTVYRFDVCAPPS